MSVANCLLDLPNEILLHIYGYLDFYDLNSLLATSLRCRELAKNEDLWKKLCEKHWLLTEKSNDGETWKENFISLCEKFGWYIISYPTIFGLWKKLTDTLGVQAPEIMDSLHDGLSESELNEFEKDYTCELPESLRLFYRICGGQERKDSNTPGLFGSFAQVYANTLTSYIFQPPSCLTLVFPVPGKMNIKYRLLSICNAGSGIEYCLVLPSKNVGQVDGIPKLYSVIWTAGNQMYAAFDSFEEFLRDHVDKVVSGRFPIAGGHVYRYDYEPECVARTGPITVRAGWIPSTTLANNDKNMLFEYQIMMSMDEDANPDDSCQLLERHWVIKHFADDKEERVDGRGVVGEYPIMKPGAKYSWMSRSFFTAPGGSMEGHFIMKNLRTSNLIMVKCPKYTMKYPQIV